MRKMDKKKTAVLVSMVALILCISGVNSRLADQEE